MAIYHLEAKVVSRGAGRSAVAASAYLSCSRLYNDYDGIQHDYTKKQGLVWQQVFLPEYAPPFSSLVTVPGTFRIFMSIRIPDASVAR